MSSASDTSLSVSREPRAERFLRRHTVLVVGAAALCVGGMAPWLPLPLLGLCLVAPVALFFARLDQREVRWSRLLPALLFAAYVGLSLWNPSHTRALDGSWRPLPSWIPWLPTTIDPERTLERAAPWLAALLQGGCLAALPRTRRSQDRLLMQLTLLVLVLAFAGAVVWTTGATKMFWALKVPGGQFFSTFVYKNHWVAFALPAACAAAGLGFSYWDRVLRSPGTEDSRKAHNRRVLCLCACVLTLASFPLPVSRSGTVIAALLAPLLVWGVLARTLRGEDRRGLRLWLFGGTAAFVAAILTLVVHMNWQSIEEGWRRSEREYAGVVERDQWNPRVYSARDTLHMALDRPWFGWGGGSFEPVFPLYQGKYDRDSQTARITARWQDAHCDWAQVAAEYGFVGLALLAGTGLLALLGTWREGGVRARWIVLGCGIVLVYALAEFPFQNPACLLLWAVLATSVRGSRRSSL